MGVGVREGPGCPARLAKASLSVSPSLSLYFSLPHQLSPHLLHVKLTRRERRGRPRSILTPGRGAEEDVGDDDASGEEAEAEAAEEAEVDASGASGLVASLSSLDARTHTWRVDLVGWAAGEWAWARAGGHAGRGGQRGDAPTATTRG